MKKTLILVLLASCVSLLPAQERVAGETPDLQTELKTLHSTISAMRRSQAAQKKTYNILAARLDSLAGAVKTTQAVAAQTTDSVARLSKTQSEYALQLEAIEGSLNTRSGLLILALVVLAGLSLVIFFTLKKAIVEASEIVMTQTAKPSPYVMRRHDPKHVDAFVVEPAQKKTPVTLPIEPELFEAVQQHAAAVQPAPAPPELHVAIAEMLSPADHVEAAEAKAAAAPHAAEAPAAAVEVPAVAPAQHKTRAKSSAQCHGVTKAGSQCKRKPVAGTHFCSQHTK